MEFEQGFEGLPALKLHDLTHGDIRTYVDDRLVKNNKAAVREPEIAQELVEEVVQSTNGVFLWVRLVVDSLLAGPRNYDRISTLRQRLHELPKDREGMYSHMLKQVDTVYLASAAQIFQLVRAGYEATASFANSLGLSQENYRVCCLLVACESDGDLPSSPGAPLPSAAECLQKYEELRLWLKTRCAGLLEVHGREDTHSPASELSGTARKPPNWTITYIH